MDNSRAVRIWLLCVYAFVFLTMVIGGITRLTGSGLSMVEWKPLIGALPPLTASQWQHTFELYQQFPQYQEVNHWMTLSDFKEIFFWEYLHRISARLIGVVFFIPWLYFILRKKIRGALARKTFVAFVLGGLQGLLGWYMVKSGLANRPEVSHLRLAAHLSLAIFVAHYILWIYLGLRGPTPKRPKDTKQFWAILALLLIVALQIIYGAFMAGSRAGYLFSSFPDMNGYFFPPGTGSHGLVVSLFYDPAVIHFLHRCLGWIVAFAVCGYFWRFRRHHAESSPKAANVLLYLIFAQFLLGVATVMTHVNITIATLHQAGGFFVVTAVVILLHDTVFQRKSEEITD